MNNEFVSVPRDPSDETLRAMLEVIRPATYRKYLRYPGAGEKTSQAEEADISVAKRQYAAVINSAQPAAQHQGDEILSSAAYQALSNENDRLLSIINQRHPGEPVACEHEWTDDGEFLLVCTACGAQEDFTQALQLAFELGGTDDGSYTLEADELCDVIRKYAHADTGEVERLRADNEALACNLRGKHALTGATYEHLIKERDTLRAQLATCNDARETLSAQLRASHTKLAERDALLLRIYNTEPLAAETSRRIETALSASAEPSAPDEDDYLPQGTVEAAIYGQLIAPSARLCVHPEGCTQCSWCGWAAPVELDERAEFEKVFKIPDGVSWDDETSAYLSTLFHDEGGWEIPDNWVGWKARAALERKS